MQFGLQEALWLLGGARADVESDREPFLKKKNWTFAGQSYDSAKYFFDVEEDGRQHRQVLLLWQEKAHKALAVSAVFNGGMPFSCIGFF